MVECSRASSCHGRMQQSQVESRGAMVECNRGKVECSTVK